MRARLATILGFVFFTFRTHVLNFLLDATRRIFTLGSTYTFRILFGVGLIGHTWNYYMCFDNCEFKPLIIGIN